MTPHAGQTHRRTGWHHGRVENRPAIARFRHSSAITVAGVIAAIAGLSLATWAVYLLPLLLIPVAVAVWGWRAGTDADSGGLTVRATLGSRRIPWSEVNDLVTTPAGRVSATLSSGRAIDLPAVSPGDLPRLVAASGQSITKPAQ